MKSAILMLLILMSLSYSKAQDSIQLVSQEVSFFKDPLTPTKSQKKAFFKRTQTLYSDGTFLDEKVRISDQKVYHRRLYKGKQPKGIWIETTVRKQVMEINTERINYCVDKKADTTNIHERDSLVSKLAKTVINKILKNTRFPEEAGELNLSGTIYIRFIVDVDGQISESCVCRSEHPILDLEGIRAIGRIDKVENPLKTKVKYTIPLRFYMI